ncbi:nucleotide disphospho-sugar-binding domain-containing protein, partial [Micromonospora sp. NPDC047753]|uniref:glycosyltransferase n=1 Tax=Micromonospora sp. NPDC047753 TaxID=3154817 RepID=UPI0033D6286F
LLPLADVVVHHGGSGTTLGALAAGVPQLLLPQGADQFANAEALTAAGVGLRLLPGEVDASAIAEQTHLLLPRRGQVDQRHAARLISEEIAGMPSPEAVAQLLPEYTA